MFCDSDLKRIEVKKILKTITFNVLFIDYLLFIKKIKTSGI